MDTGGTIPWIALQGRLGLYSRDRAVVHVLEQPVAETIVHIFDVLFALPVEVGSSRAHLSSGCDADYIGQVAIRGGIEGTVSLYLPGSTARRMIGMWRGRELSHDDDEAIADGIGEIAEMIAGGVKTRWGKGQVDMSCARVVRGDDRPIDGQGWSDRIALRCLSEFGAFSIEIACRFRDEPVIRVAKMGIRSTSGS